MNDQMQKVSVIHAVRYDGLRLDQDVLVRILHKDCIVDLLKAIDDCFTAWYQTIEGAKAWSQSCCDYNIGDMLCGPAPNRDFTRKFGFEILDDSENVIEISYDRVLGNDPNSENLLDDGEEVLPDE